MVPFLKKKKLLEMEAVCCWNVMATIHNDSLLA